MIPLLPQAIVAALTLLGPLLLNISGALPSPAGDIVSIVLYGALGLLGIRAKKPELLGTKRYVPPTLALLLVALVPALAEFGKTQDGYIKLAVEACALLCTFLAGKVLPPPAPGPDVDPVPAQLALGEDIAKAGE